MVEVQDMRTENNSSKNLSADSNVTNGTKKKKGRKRKIGVMNPYVLVRLLNPPESRLKLNKIDLHDPDTLRLMNAHFKKNRQVKKHWTYKSLKKNLFDPQISPLYKPLKGISGHYIIYTSRRTQGKKSGTGNLVGAGRPSPAITNPPKEYGVAPGNPTYINTVDPTRAAIFGDVIQGAAVDCYFHAALHSTVWVKYPNFPAAENSIVFYKNFTPKSPTAVTATFPLDTSGNLVYAQKSAANEYWAMAYEKAYAQYKGIAASILDKASIGNYPNSPYDPEIGNFADDDPLETLTEITGKAYWPNTAHPNPAAKDTTAYKIDATHNPDCYQLLNDYNKTNKKTVDNVISTMTMYPTVAWTKDAFPDISPALVASHSYSVLGTFTPNSGGTKYIVLRNPWGIAFNTGILASLAQSGAYQPSTINSAITLGNNSTLGIFALENSAFNSYFAGFGWVRYNS
jgi:hypothetical protein